MIAPCLCFENDADEAIAFYLRVFPKSEIVSQSFYTEGLHKPKGTLLSAMLKLNGLKVMVINGGPKEVFSPSLSLVITCESQDEVDYYFEAFTREGKAMPCAWVRDKFGVHWQIVPKRLLDLLADKDVAKAKRVMDAMLTMTKIDLAAIEAAATRPSLISR